MCESAEVPQRKSVDDFINVKTAILYSSLSGTRSLAANEVNKNLHSDILGCLSYHVQTFVPYKPL